MGHFTCLFCMKSWKSSECFTLIAILNSDKAPSQVPSSHMWPSVTLLDSTTLDGVIFLQGGFTFVSSRPLGLEKITLSQSEIEQILRVYFLPVLTPNCAPLGVTTKCVGCLSGNFCLTKPQILVFIFLVPWTMDVSDLLLSISVAAICKFTTISRGEAKSKASPAFCAPSFLDLDLSSPGSFDNSITP